MISLFKHKYLQKTPNLVYNISIFRALKNKDHFNGYPTIGELEVFKRQDPILAIEDISMVTWATVPNISYNAYCLLNLIFIKRLASKNETQIGIK